MPVAERRAYQPRPRESPRGLAMEPESRVLPASSHPVARSLHRLLHRLPSRQSQTRQSGPFRDRSLRWPRTPRQPEQHIVCQILVASAIRQIANIPVSLPCYLQFCRTVTRRCEIDCARIGKPTASEHQVRSRLPLTVLEPDQRTQERYQGSAYRPNDPIQHASSAR